MVSDRRLSHSAYVQDDRKVTSKLGLNLGMRYDLFSPIEETHGQQASFLPNALALIFRRNGEFARTRQSPMLLGEWGVFQPEAAALEAARLTVELLDEFACGDTFWAYRRGFGNSPLRPALARHPVRMAH
jgi:hypothetical protein